MCLSFPQLSIDVKDVRFAFSGKVFVSIAVLIISVVDSDKKLLPIFTSLEGILSSPEALSTLIFATSWTFTLFRKKQFGLVKLSFIFIILGTFGIC